MMGCCARTAAIVFLTVSLCLHLFVEAAEGGNGFCVGGAKSSSGAPPTHIIPRATAPTVKHPASPKTNFVTGIGGSRATGSAPPSGTVSIPTRGTSLGAPPWQKALVPRPQNLPATVGSVPPAVQGRPNFSPSTPTSQLQQPTLRPPWPTASPSGAAPVSNLMPRASVATPLAQPLQTRTSSTDTSGMTAMTLGNGDAVYVNSSGYFFDRSGNRLSNATVAAAKPGSPSIYTSPPPIPNFSSINNFLTSGGAFAPSTQSPVVAAPQPVVAYGALSTARSNGSSPPSTATHAGSFSPAPGQTVQSGSSSGYTFQTTPSGTVQVSQNGHIITTTTVQNAASTYGYVPPANPSTGLTPAAAGSAFSAPSSAGTFNQRLATAPPSPGSTELSTQPGS